MKRVNHELRKAARVGNEELIRTLLLEPKCNPKAADSKGETALMNAAENGHASCVQRLLPLSDAFAKDRVGWSALMCAAAHGRSLCVQLLLPVSDCLSKSMQGRTASSLATENGCLELGSLIDAYACSMSELAMLQSFTLPATARKTRSLRV